MKPKNQFIERLATAESIAQEITNPSRFEKLSSPQLEILLGFAIGVENHTEEERKSRCAHFWRSFPDIATAWGGRSID
jgi:hypothetical protein